MPRTISAASSPDGDAKFNNQISSRKSSPTERTRSRKEMRTSKTPNEGRKSRSKSRNKTGEDGEEDEGVELSPMQRRPKPSQEYEKPISGRESWWRSTIKETPVPGAYGHDDIIKSLSKRKNTYRFKSDGRKMDPQPQIGRGRYLLPGAYEHEDLERRLTKFTQTYGFKNTSREARDMMLFGKKDKDVNVPPNAYEIHSYLSIQADKMPSKHWTFKSASQRFPSREFTPKEGPGPGGYDYQSPDNPHRISSSFQSKTPRFATSHTKTPGPGSYDRMYRPMTETITKMGRHYGIFFTPRFETF